MSNALSSVLPSIPVGCPATVTPRSEIDRASRSVAWNLEGLGLKRERDTRERNFSNPERGSDRDSLGEYSELAKVTNRRTNMISPGSILKDFDTRRKETESRKEKDENDLFSAPCIELKSWALEQVWCRGPKLRAGEGWLLETFLACTIATNVSALQVQSAERCGCQHAVHRMSDVRVDDLTVHCEWSGLKRKGKEKEKDLRERR